MENESESGPRSGGSRTGGEGIKRERERKRKVGGKRAEKEAVSYESRTAGRRIKISVNKRLRWR